ncbi:glycosyltransferase [Bacteroides sedimenti]|uniref:Glycosyl transferase family 1 domain-containing protein n=1 Tax=Bacteroides sedimenti TaxID=2136147 RepID=A0ABN6Z706_9BACE
MILIINSSNLVEGGSIQVSLSLLNELIAFTDNTYHIFLCKALSAQLERDKFPSNFIFYETFVTPARLITHKKTVKYLSYLENQIKPDCVLTVFGPAYWKPKCAHVVGFALGQFIYFESPYFKQISFWDRCKFKIEGLIKFQCFNKEADAIIVETDDVNRRLSRFFKKDIYTVSNTCNSVYSSFSTYPSKLPIKDNHEIRLLTIAAFYPHKNISIIKNVLDILELKKITNIKFVITIPDEVYKSIFPLKYRTKVLNVGRTPVVECPSLYQECDIAFIPTMLECFTAAYPEAMAMKKPILTSDLGFAHSICLNAAVYFDPLNAEDIANKISLLVNNDKLQNELIINGENRLPQFLTGKERAIEYLNICQKLINNKNVNL